MKQQKVEVNLLRAICDFRKQLMSFVFLETLPLNVKYYDLKTHALLDSGNASDWMLALPFWPQ